jgi:hypothetical protein
VPIFKGKGEALNIANYRPIALTSCVRRIYERCVLRVLDNYGQFISRTQGGFKMKCSTYNQITALNEIIKKHPNAVHAFLDIKAAYDCVDRRILWSIIEKLPNMNQCLVRILKGLFDHNVSRLGIILLINLDFFI